MDSTPLPSRQILLFPARPKCPVLSPSEWWWSGLNNTGKFRWMSLLTLVYTSQQNTLQHILYPGTTKLCEWYIWHLRKLFRESTGIYNYYTIKQASTHTDFCSICLLAVMADATTASTWQLNSQLLEHLWVSLVHFPLSFESPYYMLHQTPASDITFTVCVSAFSSQCCDEPKT